jgi:hypothetical protein
VLLTVNAEPDAPAVTSVIPTQSLAVGGIPFSIDLETIFSDPDGDPLTFSSESSDAGIAEAVTNDNILVVTVRDQGTAIITVRATDPGGLTATTTFSVTGGGNRCPVRQGMIDAQILDVGASPFVVDDLNTFFSDPDGNPLRFSAISTNEQIVTAAIMGSQLTVTKVGIGLAAITVIARDGVCTADEPIAFTVTDSNAPEVINPISDQDLVAGASFVIDDLNTVFQSPDNSPLTFEAHASMEQVATVALEGPRLTVSALAVGQTLITVSASKADGRTIQDQFVVNVTAANRPPVAANDTYDVERSGTRFVSAEQGVLANDSDPDGDNITASLVSSVSHGTLGFNTDGSFIYTHDGSNTTTDSFTYRGSDGAATSNVATVTFSIFEVNVNQPPEATGDSYALLRGTTRNVNSADGVLANDSDPDGDDLTAVLVTNVSHGTLAFDDDGSFTYTHDGSAGNMDSFTYRASDGTDVSNTATVTFIIQTSDEPPEARDDFYTVEQGATLRIDPPGVLENDVDNRNSGLTAELVSDVEHGMLAFEADGSFLYRNDGVQNVQDAFTYRVNDGVENSNVATVEIAINLIGNPPPDVINPGTQQDAEGNAVSLQIQASDLDTPLTYATTNLPPGLAIDPDTGLISGLLPVGAANNSPYAVQVRVTDARGGRTIVPFQWIVTNPPPTATAPPNQTNQEGTTVSLQIQANDPGDVLTYSATGRPPNLFINPNTGVLSGTISNMAANNSPYTVTVTVTDSRGASTQVQFVWTVTNPPPNVSAPPDQMHLEGETITPVQVEAMDDDVLTYTATGLPPGLLIDEDTGEIAGTVSNTAATGSPYTVMVTVTDSQGADATTAFMWTITNAPPQVANPGNQTDAEGDDVSLQIQASDPDVPLTYGATGLPPNLSIDEGTGEIAGTISNNATNGSPYTVMVTVTDNEGAATTIPFTWTITNAPPQVTNPGDQNDEEGDMVSLQIQATDPDLPLSYAATGLPPSLTINATTGEITGTIDNDAADNSPYAVEVTVTDNDGADTVIMFDWTVTNPPPHVTDPGDQTDAEDEMVSLQIEAVDDDPDLTYAATGLPPSLALDEDTGEIAGTIDSGAASGSPYDVTVTVTDAQAASTQVQFTWTVQALNPAPTLTMVDPTSGARGTTLDVVLTGTNFATGVSAVEFDLATGIAINTTTIDSATQITLNITIDAGAALGARNITVRNAAPGGGTSEPRSFTITM